MSQSSTWDSLQIARDARLSGRPDVADEVMREVEQDLAAYSHLYCRTCTHRGDHLVFGRAPRDFLAWVGAPGSARRPRPGVGFSSHQWWRSGPDWLESAARSLQPQRLVPRDDDGEGFEIRVRSWANFVVHRPYAFFPEGV